jgi:glycosyltransferase involved in cell wall biosynthesis
MKILFLGEYDSSEITLAPIKVGKELYNELKKQSNQIFYLPYFQDGNKYSRIQKLFGFQKIDNGIFRTGIFPLLSFAVKFRPQIIHINTPGLYYMILFPLKKLLRFKIASTLHSINCYVFQYLSDIKGYQKYRFLLIEKLLVKYSDNIFVYSERDKRYVSRYYSTPLLKIKLVSNGIKSSNVKKDNFNYDLPLKVAFVGNVKRKEKSFDLMFDALSTINYPVKLSVFNHDFQEKITDYSSKNIELQFYDPLDKMELRRELVKNDLFIVPSVYESFSISLLEAMGTGIIFLASSRVGLTEKFNPQLKNLVFQKRNTKDLIDRINFYLKMDNVQKLSLSSEIINFAKNFYWEDIGKEYLKTYNDILKN